MAKRHTHRGIKPERGQDVAGVVIRLAHMGPDALGVELGHDIRRGQGVEREGHKPLAVGVVGAAQDRDARQIGQSGEVPRAEQQRIGQLLLVVVDRSGGGLYPRAGAVASDTWLPSQSK